MKEKRFTITRWCCTSGNCPICCDSPAQIRIVQLTTDSIKAAEHCYSSFRDFKPTWFDNSLGILKIVKSAIA